MAKATRFLRYTLQRESDLKELTEEQALQEMTINQE